MSSFDAETSKNWYLRLKVTILLPTAFKDLHYHPYIKSFFTKSGLFIVTMADKEATVYIVDLGSTMGEYSSGRDESNLDWSMRYLWTKIGDVAASGRKTLCAGVIGLRTDATDNPLGSEDGYENISILQPLGPIGMPALRALRASMRQNSSPSGDAISAIVVAVDMIESFTKKQKWIRKICLVTDGRAPMDADDTNDIAKKINELGILLTILWVVLPSFGSLVIQAI